jgi:hypothetical protein
MLYSSIMTSDLLSDVLDLISVRGVVSGGAVITGAWRAATPVDEPLKFCALAHGEAWLSTDGIDEPIHLVAGELAVLNGRSWSEFGEPRFPRASERSPTSHRRRAGR